MSARATFLDHAWARRIVDRLREAGDTPAADVIERLLDEREQIFGAITFEPTWENDEEASQAARYATYFLHRYGGVLEKNERSTLVGITAT